MCVLLGDLQTFEDERGLESALLPQKYKKMGSYAQLLSGELELRAPCVAISGNHENNLKLAAFPNGGYLMNNLYYLGSSVVRVVVSGRAVDICGVSGISHAPPKLKKTIPLEPFLTGEFKHTHMQEITAASVADVEKLNADQLGQALFLTHDWPFGITKLIPKSKLARNSSDLTDTTIGGPVSTLLMKKIKNQNSQMLSSHMHFDVEHFVNIPANTSSSYDVDWRFEKD